jgi:iron(II)-dependent oxidoreductase
MGALKVVVRELNEIQILRAALLDARNYTLALYAHLTPKQRQVPCLRVVNPPVWELAHIGWFQEFWCLRYREGHAPLPSLMLDCDPILNSALIPHDQRWELRQLVWGDVLHYLEHELEDTLQALEVSPPDQRYFFQLALYHEDMHGEALLMTLQTLGLPPPQFQRPVLRRPAATVAAGEVEFEGASFAMGSRPGPDFVFDNEKWAHDIQVAPFALSAATVTNAQYRTFVEAGGYARRQLWSEDGWRWREQSGSKAPRYWRKQAGQWFMRRFHKWEPVPDDEPVMHVNAHEAEAYCRFVGRRLPSEAEWEFAARAGLRSGDRFPWGETPADDGRANLNYMNGWYAGPLPVGALPGSDSPVGLRQMLGNVWEWTSTPFGPYPGFSPDPYAEYSQPWFGDHRVLRGGCFATRARLVHNRWRNFYTPERGDIFAGIRTARSL